MLGSFSLLETLVAQIALAPLHGFVDNTQGSCIELKLFNVLIFLFLFNFVSIVCALMPRTCSISASGVV